MNDLDVWIKYEYNVFCDGQVTGNRKHFALSKPKLAYRWRICTG